MWPKKEKKIDIVHKYYIVEQAVRTSRYGSLISIHPSGSDHHLLLKMQGHLYIFSEEDSHFIASPRFVVHMKHD